MTSIFTFSDSPSQVASPWSRPSRSDVDSDQDVDVDRLDAEPQDGPIEYKLHLLLRPRRKYEAMSTASKVSGSQQQRSSRLAQPSHGKPTNAPMSHSSGQTRQNRLQQLTTQLLWRLQQSSAHHAAVKGELVIPKLPDDSDDLEPLVKPRQLLPGLEESNGALYEIGVADDGTFVGLTKDEMDESMTTLKVMAASLGCRVEVQKMKLVGNCEWSEPLGSAVEAARRQGDLWVAEALVSPVLEPQKDDDGAPLSTLNGSSTLVTERSASKTEQLRISLIGPTTSGKTSLLGTLVNGTLDNSRGSNRIDLLRHSHERVSGQTSSVAQEIIGYKDDAIFNFSGVGPNTDIKTWTDIHDRSEDGRLVFISDSAGHLRFRRTILRGLVGWAPHWTLLCVAANEVGVCSRGTHSLSGTTDDLADMVGSTDLAMAHLELCLKLEIPTVIIITKFDLIDKDTRSILSTILSKVKAAGRIPRLLLSKSEDDAALTRIPASVHAQVDKEVLQDIQESGDLVTVTPIVFASSVKGQGIGYIHALLRNLPVPPTPTARDFAEVLNPEQPAALFHIDDKYELKSFRSKDLLNQESHGSAIVVAGYLRFGKLSIGDKVVIGPFPADDEDQSGQMPLDHPSPGRAISLTNPWSMRTAVSASNIQGEWHNATIVNLRNLRLPVRTMEAGQAGTIQLAFDDPAEDPENDAGFGRGKPSAGFIRNIRKGQVVAVPSQHMLDTGISLQAATGLTAAFKDPDVVSLAVGSLVNVYVATVRAAARILQISRQEPEPEGVFSMADDINLDRPQFGDSASNFEHLVSLELLTNREWIELGSQVVLMKGALSDGPVLEGFVGRVFEIIE